MACNLEQIKKDTFEIVKNIVEGKASSISMNEKGLATFDYTVSTFYKDQKSAYAVAQNKLKLIESWATKKFGKRYSKGWGNVYEENGKVYFQYTFPSNLNRAYQIKEAMDLESENQAKTLREAKALSLQEQLDALNQDNAQGIKDLYGYQYNSIDEMVNGILQEMQELEEFDAAISGNPTLATHNYDLYYKEKEATLKSVSKTIDRLYTEKRVENTPGISKKISDLTAIKEGLEKDLDDYSKSKDKFTQVKSFFNKDIALIQKLVASPTLENLYLAQDIFKFIKLSADINDANNKIFKAGPNEIYETEVKAFIEDLNTKIPFIQKGINDALDIEFTNLLEKYEDKLESHYPGKTLNEIKEILLSNLQDIFKVESTFMTVDTNLISEADLLAQLLRLEYERVNEREKSKTQKLIQAIDGLLPTVQEELKKLGYVTKTKIGSFINYQWLYRTDAENNPKSEVISKYSAIWDNFVYSLNKDYNTKVFQARQNKQWADLESLLTSKYNDLNDKVDFVDFSLLHDIFNAPEYDEFKQNDATKAATYKADLTAKIGEEEYEDLVNRQRNYLDAFMEERELIIQSKLAQEKVNSVSALSQQIQDNMNITIDRLNPAKFVQSHLAGTKNMITYTIGTQSNEKPSYLKYNTYTPKAVSNGNINTNFYDSRFKTIENNPNLYAFWKVARNSVHTVNENLIDSDLNLSKNSILLFKKSFRENLMHKNYLQIARAGLSSFTNIKQFFKNAISSKDVDRTDNGEIVLPQDLNSFEAAVSQNFNLLKTDIANLLGRGVKGSTLILWKGLTPDSKKGLLELLGVENELDFIQDIKMREGKFPIGALRLYSERQVFEQQTLNVPSMLKAQLELSAEHKSRSIAKNRLDIILQKTREVKDRRKRQREAENTNNGRWTEDRKEANIRNDFFVKQIVYNDKKDAVWGNISNQLKKLSKSEDGRVLGTFFYKNYTPAEKQIYYSAVKRLDKIKEELGNNPTKKQAQNLLEEQEMLEKRILLLGKDYLGSAIYNAAVNKLSIFSNMAYSLTVPINNYANGQMMLFNRDGEFWEKGNINLAWHYVTQNKLRFTNKKYKESWAMMGAFIKQLNIIQDGTNELQRAEDNTSFLQKGILHPMYGTELAEWYNQVPGILSMAMDIEVAPGVPLFDGKTFPAHHLVNGVFTLKDEFRTPENIKHFEEISSDKMLEWKGQINNMIRSLAGDYSKTGVTRIKGGVVGKSIMQYKTWLPRYLYSRLAYKQKELSTGKEHTGYLLSSLINPKTRITAGALTVGTLAVGAMAAPTAVVMLPLIAPLVGLTAASYFIRRDNLRMDLSEIINIKSQLSYLLKAGTIGLLETPVNLAGGAFGQKKILDFDNSFKGELNAQETADLRLLTKHMQFSMTMLLLRLIIQSMLGDNEEDELKGEEGSAQRARWVAQQKKKEEDSELYNLLENFFTARMSELNMANDPKALFSTMGSRNGVESNLDRVTKAFVGIAEGIIFPEDDIISQGPQAGESKAGNAWRKFLPGLVRNVGKDSWKGGFETWTDREFQNNDFTDKVFDSDYKIDKKEVKGKQKTREQELIKEYEETNQVKLEELEPEKRAEIEKEIKSEAKEQVPNIDRDLYDDEQNLIEP